MKVSLSIRSLFEELRDDNDRLKDKVDALLLGHKHQRWHYESRLKGLESFALKLEACRVTQISEFEDFFACWLVVENRGSVQAALELVQEHFSFRYMKPPEPAITHKKSCEFPFDDLRVYARWKADPALPPTGLEDITFEIQIKTFLQHAWSIATHDLVYKADRPSWAKERIAFEIKAMLEHAETSICGAEALSGLPELQVSDKETQRLVENVAFLKRTWPLGALPADLVRLGTNVGALLRTFSLSLAELESALVAETNAGAGTALLDLSPYSILVQTILRRFPGRSLALLAAADAKRRVFIVPEIDTPGLDRTILVSRVVTPDSLRGKVGKVCAEPLSELARGVDEAMPLPATTPPSEPQG